MKFLSLICALLFFQVSNAEYLENLKIKKVVDGDTVLCLFQRRGLQNQTYRN